MMSHLCTMIMEGILVYIVFLTATVTVRGIEIRKSPFGPLMCERLCHHTVGCVYFFYTPQDLTCHLGNISTVLDREALKITISKVAGNTSKDISKCSRNSKTYQSRSQKLVCLKKKKRCNTISNDVQDSLQSIQPRTATPRRNTAFVQCSANKLHRACRKGDLRRVQRIVSEGHVDINCRGRHMRTPVMEAASKGLLKVFDYLVGQGCDLYCVGSDNNTVIHKACQGGNVVIVKKLIGNGYFDFHARGFRGRTPLLVAVYYGHINVFTLLRGMCSEVNEVDNENNNILHIACMGGHVNMVNHILHLKIPGIDIGCRGVHGRTPLMQAAIFGRVTLFKILISKGSNVKIVDTNEENILHLACMGLAKEKVEMVKYILSLHIDGVGIDSKGIHGRTPVMRAVNYKQRKFIEQLQVIKFLVSQRCNLSVVDDDGNNILHLACSGGNVDIVKYIISLGAVDEKLENKNGHTPLQLAESRGYSSVVARLRETEKNP